MADDQPEQPQQSDAALVNPDVDQLVQDDARDGGDAGSVHSDDVAAPNGGQAEAGAQARKRKRGAAKIEADLELAKSKKQKKLEAVLKLRAKPNLWAKDRAQLEKYEKELAAIEQNIAAMEQNLENVRASEQASREATAAKQQRREAEAEGNRAMSPEGAKLLVNLKMRYEHRFDNNSDKVDAVWEHVHKEFVQAANRDEIPASDVRSADALKHRCASCVGAACCMCACAC